MVGSSESWQKSVHKITAAFHYVLGDCSEESLKVGAGEAPRKQHQVKSGMYMGKEAGRPRFTFQS